MSCPEKSSFNRPCRRYASACGRNGNLKKEIESLLPANGAANVAAARIPAMAFLRDGGQAATFPRDWAAEFARPSCGIGEC
jgi:hypothetical protein